MLLILHVLSLCFFALNSSHFVSEYFLLNRVSLNSLKLVAIFTSFAVLDSLPSSESTDYIFDLQTHFISKNACVSKYQISIKMFFNKVAMEVIH